MVTNSPTRRNGGEKNDTRSAHRHYTHRVAISNHRRVSFANDQVTFRWRDSAHNSEHKLMTLTLDEFLRRFLLHLLPKGFVRIRHFGFLANRRRTALLPLCYRLLDAVQPSQSEPEASPAKELNPLWLCPQCGGSMVVIERLTAAQLQLRSPPWLAGAAALMGDNHTSRATTIRIPDRRQ
jgi:Putative transposase